MESPYIILAVIGFWAVALLVCGVITLVSLARKLLGGPS
jgi:hypothetical protein